MLYVADELHETGLYDLKKQDSTVSVLAFNDNRSESDLSYLSNFDLKKLLPQASAVVLAGKGSLKDAVTETNFGMQLWKLCIILALFFLGAEIALIRYYKADRRGMQPGQTQPT